MIVNSLIEKILWKIFYIKSSISKNSFYLDEKYSKNFNSFNKKLSEITDTNLDIHYTLRYSEIFYIVKKFNIKSILEIGSGRTTFIFNALSEIECISMEQDKLWLNTLSELLRYFNIDSKIIFENVIPWKNGARFLNIPNYNPEMLYIDGPYFKNGSNIKFDTHTGKAAYYDFEELFKKNIYPKIIMIDGRTDTVDEILRSNYFRNKYNFYPEFIYSIQRKNYISALNFKRHSLFIKK